MRYYCCRSHPYEGGKFGEIFKPGLYMFPVYYTAGNRPGCIPTRVSYIPWYNTYQRIYTQGTKRGGEFYRP